MSVPAVTGRRSKEVAASMRPRSRHPYGPIESLEIANRFRMNLWWVSCSYLFIHTLLLPTFLLIGAEKRSKNNAISGHLHHSSFYRTPIILYNPPRSVKGGLVILDCISDLLRISADFSLPLVISQRLPYNGSIVSFDFCFVIRGKSNC